jgi:pilus assembly protein FimV
MSMTRWLLMTALLAPGLVNAAGLGNITVSSALGQPLRAEISLISVGRDDLSNTSVRLLPSDAYKDKNLQFNSALVGARATIERRAGGQPVIQVVSTRAVTDPYLDLLVELGEPGGTKVREYTILLDPPGYGANASMIAPPVVVAEAKPAVAKPVVPQPAPAARALAPVAAPPPAAPQKYNVKRGDTLGKIARSLKPADVSLEQMLAGLYRNNPGAFINNNMNLLRAGATLQVPDREQLLAVPQQDAVKEYRVQVANWQNYRRNLADAAPTAPAARMEKSEPDTAASVKVIDPAKSAQAGKPVLRLSAGAPPEGGKPATTTDRVRMLEEELVSQSKALEEANERIKRLEKALQSPAAASRP